MQNKKANINNYDKSVALRALAGMGAGAGAGALVDSGDRERGALTGGAIAGLLHAPNLVGRALRNEPTVIDNAVGDLVMEHPKFFGGISAGAGAIVGGSGTAMLDYRRLRNERNGQSKAASAQLTYTYGRKKAVARLGL